MLWFTKFCFLQFPFPGGWVGEKSGTWVAMHSSERDLWSCLQTTNILCFDLEHFVSVCCDLHVHFSRDVKHFRP